MLPDFLVSSYRQYKDDTAVFMTWLRAAAEACGYKNKAKEVSATASSEASGSGVKTPASSQRIKGKARKTAKRIPPMGSGNSLDNIAAVKHAVSMRELVAQVNTICSSKARINMPKSIKGCLKQAIDARQRCSDWYENTEHKKSVYDEGGHRFFIKVLQDAFAKLDVLEERHDTFSKHALKKSTPKDKRTIRIENRFSHLNIEDVDDSYHPTPTETALATSNTPQHIPDSVNVFELEEKRAFEDAFSVFCLFEDLNRVRSKLKGTWEDCNSGEINLITATVVTQAAIYMARKGEEGLRSTLFPGKPVDNCYETLAGMMVSTEPITSATDPMNGSGVDATQLDSFTFLPVARTLLKFVRTASSCNDTCSTWSPPVMPLRFNYIQGPHKAEIPEHSKLQRDDELLSQLLLHLQLPDKVKGERKDSSEIGDMSMLDPPVRDIFSRNLQPVWTDGKVSLTAVFTAQILLDILGICSDLPNFPRQLAVANAYAWNSFDFKATPEGKLITGDLSWPTSAMDTLLGIYKMTKQIKAPAFAAMKTSMLETSQTHRLHTWDNLPLERRTQPDACECPSPEMQTAVERMSQDLIKPEPAIDFAVTHNPLYSGTAMLKLVLEHQEAGLALANHHLSIFVVAHLYNALRQLKMVEQEWPLMEHIIKLHKRALFADVIPTTTDEIADRFSYRINIFQTQKRFYKDEKYKFRAPVATKMICSLLDTQLPVDQVLWQIETQIDLQNNERQTNAASKSSRASQRRKRQVDPEEFIENVRDVVSRALDDASIDYVRLTKRCARLVDDFRRMWFTELEAAGLGLPSGSDNEEDIARNYGLLLICHEAFQGAKLARRSRIYTYRPGDGGKEGIKGRSANPDNPNRHGMGLLMASKVFNNFLANDVIDLRFPLCSSTEGGEPTEQTTQEPWVIHRPSSAAELQKLFSSTTYVAVDFCTDYDNSDPRLSAAFAEQSRLYGIPGIFAFAKTNADYVPEFSKKCCKGIWTPRTFVFFKDGKQVTVNGKAAIVGSDIEGLEAAAKKVGELAKKRVQRAAVG
ncbi:hypothetical protein F5Y05DRAFT_418364 [Hypoxylon sp. FL0543]|nr:hypothetical protein F5Y05DRAFT_418364 [Hypoxylon sp. FL0543]